VRSVGRLIVSAPRSARTRAAAGFAAGSITDTFACMSAGTRPARRASANAASTPRSAIRTLRKPWSAARRASSRQATTCSCPRDTGAKTPPAGARAAAEVSQAAFGRANRLTSSRASAASRAVSSSTASRQLGPSVLGISIRYCAPSGKRLGESGSSFRSPGGRPIVRRKSRVSLIAAERNSDLRLLEQRLPPSEQLLQLRARRGVRGEELGVAPVVRELLLQLGDRFLRGGDLCLDPFQGARPLRHSR